MREVWDMWNSGPGRATTVGTWLAAILIGGVVSGAAEAHTASSGGAVRVALADPEPTEPLVIDQPKPSLVLARIDLSDQKMTIYVDEKLAHTFNVSTGRGSYRTPTGRWQAKWLSPRHRSRKYNNAPMPWSVFYYKGYAVHGTTEIRNLGRPASHGCVRLHPDNAEIFFKLVKATGMANTLITVVR